MNRLRMAVVGVGSLGKHHARILAGLDDVELVAVADPRSEQGQTIAARFGADWFAAIEQLPSGLDGVIIATPTVRHRETAEFFLRAGTAVLVEKPLAACLVDARFLGQLAAESGLSIEHQWFDVDGLFSVNIFAPSS